MAQRLVNFAWYRGLSWSGRSLGRDVSAEVCSVILKAMLLGIG